MTDFQKKAEFSLGYGRNKSGQRVPEALLSVQRPWAAQLLADCGEAAWFSGQPNWEGGSRAPGGGWTHAGWEWFPHGGAEDFFATVAQLAPRLVQAGWDVTVSADAAEEE